MVFDFSGKVAVISGAASGMGLVFSKRFVESGGRIVMSDINKETLDKAVDEVNSIREGAAYGMVCDVRKYDEVKAIVDFAVKKFGRVDITIPFAGGAETRMLGVTEPDFEKIPIEVFDWSIDVNLRSQLYFDHAVFGIMKEQRSGVLIHIGSVTGAEGGPNVPGYSASKSGAMNGLTVSMAQLGAKHNIRCVCVSPGPVMTRASMANMKTLLGRAASPEEVVNAILYYASEDGSFYTGINVLIDGGRHIMWDRNI
ncbi:MAG: SDR family oxidoreductase [Clostridia bacterium]|nr:SDR family oxidoreductase [Clostridia bacterium]